MKPFEQLTQLGKLRRLHRMAARLLGEYDLKVNKLNFLTIETNTYFKIITDNGQKYVLRIYSDEETTIRDNLAEIFWLCALIRDTDIHVTRPVARSDGQYLSVINETGLPPDRRCVLFEWIAGTNLEHRLSPETYCKLGGIMAGLHNHAELLDVPQDIRPKKWDKVFYYPDEPLVIFDEKYSNLFNETRRHILKEAILHCTADFDKLYEEKQKPILVHGDLHFYNVHIYKNVLYLIDFEDIMRGHPVQDIAVTFYYGRDRDDYAKLCAAFKDGYASQRRWPAKTTGMIESQMAARAIMFTNYVARICNDPESFVDAKCRELADFLTNGRMWTGKK